MVIDSFVCKQSNIGGGRMTDFDPGTIGYSVEAIRRGAKLTQADLASRVSMSAATISRIENGEAAATLAEIGAILDAIDTSEAREFKTFLSDEWTHLERPSFHHPDRGHLWCAEKLLQETEQLKRDALASFEKQIVIYEKEIKGTAQFLMDQSHDIAFVGEIGVGKTTAICSLAELRLPDEKVFSQQMVLEAGGGGTTLCEVQIESGPQYGLVIEPRPDIHLQQDVADFSASLVSRIDHRNPSPDGPIGVSRELERAIRNMAGLSVVSRRDSEGSRHRRDPARELAKNVPASELTISILMRMKLQRRNERTIWYSETMGDDPLKWLQSTYADINNGRHPGFSLPERIQVVLPQPLLNHEKIELQITDTKGIDQTSERSDIERHFDNPRTLVILCSKFKSAPEPTVQTLLQRARDAGVPDVSNRSLILILAQPTEAVSMKDYDGNLVVDDEEGYDMKLDQVNGALGSLGLSELPVIFFNAMSDDPEHTRAQVIAIVESIRKHTADRIDELAEVVCRLKINREQEEAQAVLNSAMRRVAIWLDGSANLGHIPDKLHHQLLSAIRSAHARSVWASTRRKGEWYNLDFGYHLGRGARTVAAKYVQVRLMNLESVVQNLLDDVQFAHAHDFLKEILHYVGREVPKLLQQVELMGRDSYHNALSDDSQFWSKCESRWGQGGGYRDDIATYSNEWFKNTAAVSIRIVVLKSIYSGWEEITLRLRQLIDSVTPEELA